MKLWYENIVKTSPNSHWFYTKVVSHNFITSNIDVAITANVALIKRKAVVELSSLFSVRKPQYNNKHSIHCHKVDSQLICPVIVCLFSVLCVVMLV